VQPVNDISTLIEQNKLLMDMMRQMQIEMNELKENLKPINKALNHKTKKVTKKEKDDDFLKKFRASQLI